MPLLEQRALPVSKRVWHWTESFFSETFNYFVISGAKGGKTGFAAAAGAKAGAKGGAAAAAGFKKGGAAGAKFAKKAAVGGGKGVVG